MALGTVWSLLPTEAHKQTDLTSKASSFLPRLPVVLNNKITGLSTAWQCSLMAAFPSREIPSCRLSSAPAKHQVGFTHPVKGIMSRSSGPTYQCTEPTCCFASKFTVCFSSYQLTAKIACEAMVSQVPKKYQRSTNGREIWLEGDLCGAGATESH